MQLQSYGRKITYLRISITDKCNLRCRYCMPEEGVPHTPHDKILRAEELRRLTGIFCSVGITKIRITGGEPLVSRILLPFVSSLADLCLEDLSLTTNGQLLPQMAEQLKKAGINRVNISLDSLNPERFSWITRGGDLQKTLDGIDAALEAGLNPVKINTVMVRGYNDDEAIDIALLAKDRPLHIRFIEFMPLGEHMIWGPESYISRRETIEKIASLGTLTPRQVYGNGPAEVFTIPGFMGTIGFIDAMSGHFCSSCNRLRLTCDGRLYSCLHNQEYTDLLGPLRAGASDKELLGLIVKTTAEKPRSHNLGSQNREMNTIGG